MMQFFSKKKKEKKRVKAMNMVSLVAPHGFE